MCLPPFLSRFTHWLPSLPLSSYDCNCHGLRKTVELAAHSLVRQLTSEMMINLPNVDSHHNALKVPFRRVIVRLMRKEVPQSPRSSGEQRASAG